MTLALFLVLSCTTVVLTGGGREDADYQLRWVLVASDLFLGLAALAYLAQIRAIWRDWHRHQCAVGAAALALSLLPSLALHPADRGVAAVLRWFGVAMVVFALGRLAGAGRTLVLGAFAGVTVLQVAVGVAQRVAGGPLGLDVLGEARAYEIGGHYASSGLSNHPYVFAAWSVLGGAILLAAVARGRASAGLRIAAVTAFVGVGLTMSRAGALAVVAVLAVFALVAWRRPRLRAVLAGCVLAAGLGAGLNLPGWVNRSATSLGEADVTSGRTELLDQAWGLLSDHPVVGVGPGRYVPALVERPDLVALATQRPSRPVHVTPYLILVEGGLAVLPALVLVGWAVVSQVRRAGAPGVMVGLALAPFLLLDHLNWSYPQGLLLTALWLGALDQLGSTDLAREAAAPELSARPPARRQGANRTLGTKLK